MRQSPQTLNVEDRRVVASWAADCAERVLPIFEDAVADDDRVRAAINQTRSFAAGELDVADAVRRRGGEAGAAAREASAPAARAAAYVATDDDAPEQDLVLVCLLEGNVLSGVPR